MMKSISVTSCFSSHLNRVNPSHHLAHAEYLSCVQCLDKSGLLSVMFDINFDWCDCFFSRISPDITVANWYSTLFNDKLKHMVLSNG